MFFIDEITDINKFKKIYKIKNKFILKILNKKINEKINKNNNFKNNLKNNLIEFIYKLIYYYMNFFGKNIKKIINIGEDGINLNILYLINNKNIKNNKKIEKIIEKNDKDKLNQKNNNKNIKINKKDTIINKNKLINIIKIKKEKNKYSKLIKIIKIIKKYNFKNVILSNNLYNDDKIKDILINNKINIIDGKTLYEALLFKIVEKISIMQKTKIEKYELSILIKEKNEIRVSNIIKLAKKCKILNIITNNIKQFEKLEKYLKNKYGIILNVTTNTDKSLLNSNIIINLDYLFDEFSNINLPRKTIILNIKNNIKIYSNFFEGINITDYLIYLPEKYNKIVNLIENINPVFLYEAVIIEENLIQSELERKINFDKIDIKYFLGNNGKIRGREFLKVNSIKNLQEKQSKHLTKKYNNRNILPLVKNQT